MHSNIFVLIWRRKLSILLISSSLILFSLWTWVFFLDANSLTTKDGHILQELSSNGNSDKQASFLLERLITQANRILRYQHQQNPLQDHLPQTAAQFSGGETKTKSSGVVRFVKSTKGPLTAVIEEASAQTLALVTRHKKNKPVVGESLLFEEERLRILENQQRARNAGIDDMYSHNNNNLDYDRLSMMSSAERQSQYEHELQRMGVPVIAGIGPDSPQAPNERLVHLDLKGAPPKLSFLKSLLPLIKSLGATGLLIEYEDMFPYTGVLEKLAAKNAYKAEELKDFLETAAMHGLSVMPLVQTFGHMEYALKLEGFEHMRELPENPQSICPSKKESLSFIEHMLMQVVEFHLQLSKMENTSSSSGNRAIPSDYPLKFTHIHIGCDEVSRMGECDKCRQRSRNEIFLTHVTTIANFVRSHWPHLKVVIWDDMLRDMSLSEMQHSHIGNYVEPMIWVYVTDIYHFIQPQLWDMYAKVFPTAWAASAFKGVFGESIMIPPLQRHLENNIRWLAVMAKEGGRFSKGFKGLALTGWQRYDHFAVLCELLPAGIPSLITALSTVSKGFFSSNPKENSILRVIECAFHPDSRHSGHPWIELHPNSHHSQLFTVCTYPGSNVYKYTLRLFDKLFETQNYLQHVQDKSAWMSAYNVRHNFSSPLRVQALTGNTPGLLHELTALAQEAYTVMYEVFDEHTIAEFVEQNIYPVVGSLHQQLQNAQSLLQRRVWPQRPLPYSQQMIDYNLVPQAGVASSSLLHHQSPH